jgi:hypothetical protein
LSNPSRENYKVVSPADVDILSEGKELIEYNESEML